MARSCANRAADLKSCGWVSGGGGDGEGAGIEYVAHLKRRASGYSRVPITHTTTSG